MTALSPVAQIIEQIRAGRMVILVDEEDRENEGDLVLAADFVTAEAINFMARNGRGLICLTLTEARCRQLDLPLMVRDNRSPNRTAFTVSIEAATGVTTGISAQDRARTIQVAVARDAKPSDIVQPGHVFPLMAQNGGVLVRAGHTEAGCDLAELAGAQPAAVICEILNEDGSMARLPDLVAFAHLHGLKIGAIRDLITFRAASEQLVARVAEKQIDTPHGPFRLVAYSDRTSGDVHLALIRGDIQRELDTVVRVHVPISVLDFLDLGERRHSFSVDRAMRIVAQRGRGVIVLLHRPETGQDLLAAFSDAAPTQVQRWDPRLYGIGAQILRDLDVGKMRLLMNPQRMPSMAGFGLEVSGFLSREGEDV